MSRKHVVITGTGRAGTTFLVELLTHLGLETGFKSQNIKLHKNARAGLERDIRREGVPYIVKSPWFCDYADEVLKRDDIVIEHVFIPMRDLHATAESRRYVHERAVSKLSLLARFGRKTKRLRIPGGLWHTKKKSEQEQILLQQIYKLALALSDTTIPVTLLRYPRIVRDSRYLYRKLEPILGEIHYDQFRLVFENTVRPDWVHSFNENDC